MLVVANLVVSEELGAEIGPLARVETPEIGGVRIKRHVLDLEANSLAQTMRRLGLRLRYWMNSTKHEFTLPDRDTRETFRIYAQTVLDLLKEQRERAKMAQGSGAPAISDADFEHGLRNLVEEQLKTMDLAELESIIAKRMESQK